MKYLSKANQKQTPTWGFISQPSPWIKKECILPTRADYHLHYYLYKNLYKSGDSSDVANYRLVSAPNSIPKLFENLVCNHLTRYFNNIIIDQ